MAFFSTSTFQCPLLDSCFADAPPPFRDTEAVNEAVEHFRETRGEERERLAQRLFLRHLPLVRKILAGFCYRSHCYAGGCHIEEMVGDSYVIFRVALEQYDPSYDVDFLGYVSRRLSWRLKTRLEELEDWWEGWSVSLDSSLDSSRTVGRTFDALRSDGEEETRVLARVFRKRLLEVLDEEEVELVVLRYERGYSSREIADELDVSHAAIRKRLERIRRRLREIQTSPE